MKPRGSRFEILYGLYKVHKHLIDNCPTFRPIMSAIRTPTYNLAKFLVSFREPIATHMYTVKRSFKLSQRNCWPAPKTVHGQSGYEVPLY